MNIVVVGPQFPDSLAKCVFETLKDMGHTAHSVDERKILLSSRVPDRGRTNKWTIGTGLIEDSLMRGLPKFEIFIYDRLCRMIEPYEPYLIITHSAWIPPQTISRLKKVTGALIVCWFPDQPANLGRQYMLAGKYDVLFFKDQFLVELARRINKNAFYLPECIQPKWHRKVRLSNEEIERYSCDITIAGNLYYHRALVLQELIEDYDVKMWGPPVPRWLRSPVSRVHQNHYVAELEKAKAFSGAKICLNTFRGEVSGVNVRTFEIAGCGGFQICEFRPAIKDLFVLGEEIVVFDNLNDLKEKIGHYIARPEERQAIAERAHKRAHREHTYEKRLGQMLDIVKSIQMGKVHDQ